jgi:hypothetical protein
MELPIKKPPWVNVFSATDKCSPDSLINKTSFKTENDFLTQTTLRTTEFLIQEIFLTSDIHMSYFTRQLWNDLRTGREHTYTTGDVR